jgi:hypothetical protein
MKKPTLATKTKSELLKLARRLGLRGITTLRKDALASKISAAQQQKKTNLKHAPALPAAARKTAAPVRRRAIRKRPGTAAPVTAPPPKIARKRRLPAAAGRRKPVSAAAAAAVAAHKFDVAPTLPPPSRAPVAAPLGELPESYGTGRLFLVARDPGWLYVYWDLSGRQMADARQQAADGRLVLRLFEKNIAAPRQELALHHDSRNWYISGARLATTYRAELGYWEHGGRFHLISASRETTTPSAVLSSDRSVRYATIPVDMPREKLARLVRSHGRHGEPLAEALHRLQAQGAPLPFRASVEVGALTPEQEAAVERAVGGAAERTQAGSLEISEWLRQQLLGQPTSGLFSPGGASGPEAPGGPGGRRFWFAVSAELVIRGATEPGASVLMDGVPVPLNEDGTFECRYSFPDGQFRLPVMAVSASGGDRRAADLSFERKTNTAGEVGEASPVASRTEPS